MEELRTAFNTMLEHIDGALAVRAEAEQRLRRFVADASHELRTPLMVGPGLRGPVPVRGGQRARGARQAPGAAARRGGPDGCAPRRPAAARPAGRGRAETPLRLQDVDLTELVRQAADALRAGRPDRPLTVTTGPGAVRLRLDPQRIRQVLDNLLTNAAVHTPPGTKVTLAVSVLAGCARVTVADTGPGIPPADRHRIFDRFYRVDKARSRDRGGSGLGLAVANSLVEAHGGTIELSGEPGATAFTVTLPLRPDAR
ncbi:hypothetical protein GCM10010377_07130 [Streptomyces viridiviolaceus]|nr:hypothetical protein GCM10010377_07130 [Streptomyces viridiviolaceus]